MECVITTTDIKRMPELASDTSQEPLSPSSIFIGHISFRSELQCPPPPEPFLPQMFVIEKVRSVITHFRHAWVPCSIWRSLSDPPLFVSLKIHFQLLLPVKYSGTLEELLTLKMSEHLHWSLSLPLYIVLYCKNDSVFFRASQNCHFV